MARAPHALLLALAAPALAPAALFACSGGGSPAQPVGPGNTTLADAQSDVTLEVGADEGIGDGGLTSAEAADAAVPDGQCPAMFPPTCQAGQTCTVACNVCTCDPDGGGLWACTTKGCPVQGDP